MERFIRGGIQFTGQFSQQKHYQKVTQARCKAADYQPNLSVVSLDIECSEKGILYSVGLDSHMDSRVIMIGDPQHGETGLHIQWVENEYALLIALIAWFEQFDPDIIIGWNVIDFDFRLLAKRAEWHKLPLKLGRAQQNCISDNRITLSKALFPFPVEWYLMVSTLSKQQPTILTPGR